MDKLLEVKDLNVYYGPVHAVDNVSFSLEKGEIFTILGANAAGKSSTLSSISGIVKPASGSIRFKGEEIAGALSYKTLAKGIVHVPEGREVFPALTVQENPEMGAYIKWKPEVLRRGIERAYTLFPVLGERRKQVAGTLSGGEQQMLAISRGLMSDPELLLLDEPSMGLAPKVVATIFNVVREINQSGVTIIMVEQNAKVSLQISQHAIVLDRGKQVLSGTAEELRNNPQVQAAYLGT